MFFNRILCRSHHGLGLGTKPTYLMYCSLSNLELLQLIMIGLSDLLQGYSNKTDTVVVYNTVCSLVLSTL